MNKENAKKICIVEDNDILSSIAKEELLERGFMVYTASDGEEGLELIKKVHPDLVLLDIVMPKMDGHAVLDVLKQDEKLKNIPVVMLTVSASDEDAGKCVAKGAVDYIIKSQQSINEIVDKILRYIPQ
jgi:CheY-like chemotaxis protein